MKRNCLQWKQTSPFGGDTQRDQNSLSEADLLFAMLDGQVVGGEDGFWRAEVVGIHSEIDGTWVQIGPARQPAQSVAMRLPSVEFGQRALDALSTWAAMPEDRRPSVIDLC